MLSNYGKTRLLEAIFNEGALGDTLYAVLHTEQNTGNRTMNPTSNVAGYTSYSAVALSADDDSVFEVVGNELRLVEVISFPANSGITTQTLTYLSICTGITSGDAVLAVAPIKMGGNWFETVRGGASQAINFYNTRGGSSILGASPNIKYRAYKYLFSPDFQSGTAPPPNTFPEGAKWSSTNQSSLRETQNGSNIQGLAEPFPFMAHMHVVADVVLEPTLSPVVGSYEMTGRPLLKIY